MNPSLNARGDSGASTAAPIGDRLDQLDRFNRRLGLRQRLGGLHYWLGFEYALALDCLAPSPQARLLDIGSGGHSIWPHFLAHRFDARVTILDIDPMVARHRQLRQRAVRAGLYRAEQVEIVRGDARALPFADGRFDAFTAMSSMEHTATRTGDRKALQEASRTLRPGGHGLLSVPFHAESTWVELDEDLALYQRHYSTTTLADSLLTPSGLQETGRCYYAEKWPVYRNLRRLPPALRHLLRPWHAGLSRRAMQLVEAPQEADAIMLTLTRP
ncbi:MAG: class I SAM-dependent methyltransferase [Guyparkeria sp.]